MKNFIRVGDLRVAAFDVLGTGEPLLCIPGGPGYGGDQLGNLGGLDASRQLVRCDLRGAGASDPPANASWSISEYAADVDLIRQAMGVETVAVMGHAHGALIAARYALEFPKQVRALVLDAVPVRRIAEVEAESTWKVGEYFSNYDDRAKKYVSDHMGTLVEDALAWFWDHEANDDLAAPLLQVQKPVLLIDGSDDPLGGDSATRELANRMHDCRVEVIEGASHFPWVDQPERYARAVDEFLSKLDG